MLGPQSVWVDVTSLEDIFIVLHVCCVLHSIDKDSAMFQCIYSSILSFSSSEGKCLYTGSFTRIHTVKKRQSAGGASCSPFQKGLQLPCWTPTSCLVNPDAEAQWALKLSCGWTGSRIFTGFESSSTLKMDAFHPEHFEKGDEILQLLQTCGCFQHSPGLYQFLWF